MSKVIYCACCGKPMVVSRNNVRFCNDKECQYMRMKLSKKEKRAEKKHKPSKDTIGDLSVEARRLGLSYGQYFALRDTHKLDEYKRRQFRRESEIKASEV